MKNQLLWEKRRKERRKMFMEITRTVNLHLNMRPVNRVAFAWLFCDGNKRVD